jgi:hypothetical protein
MTEALVVGGLLALGLLIAVLYEATRRRKNKDDDRRPD